MSGEPAVLDSGLNDRVEGPGERVRELRKIRSMTLQQLAETVGISIGHLSQIERNQAQLTVATLSAIADALGVRINYFFGEPGDRFGPEHGVIVRAEQRQTLRYARTGVVDELLVPDLNGPLEVLMSHFAPGADTDFYSHVGAEAGLVVEGELELTVGEAVFALREGDSFAFRSAERHRGRNLTDRPARVVWVVTPPAF